MSHNNRDKLEKTEPNDVPEALNMRKSPVATPPSMISSSSEHKSDPKSSDCNDDSLHEPQSTVVDNRMKRRVVNRCSGCRKNVGLMGLRCRCGEMFCSEHRYSDRHDCRYDYKAAGRDVIARQNPMVRATKILKV